MSQRRETWMMVVFACLLVGSGCAREATEKVAEAERDLEDAWIAEKNAAVSVLKESVDATGRQIQQMRAKAAELEQAAATDAAKAWHRMADGLEAARTVAAHEVQVAEGATKAAWDGAHDAAKAATADLERAGKRAAGLASDAKDEFVAEARAAVEEGERELAWAKEQAAAAGEATRKEWDGIVADLEAKQKKAVAELNRVEAAEAGAWGEMRHGFVAAYHDLADAAKRARQRLATA